MFVIGSGNETDGKQTAWEYTLNGIVENIIGLIEPGVHN